jgi:putative SOS response-associated peptidase YedK
MCGRLNLHHHPAIQDLFAQFGLELARDRYEQRYNVAPTARIPVVFRDDKPAAAIMQWGITPRWSRPNKSPPALINARAETVREKPTFRKLIAARRCVIPANGFYEWKREASRKAAHYITPAQSQVFALAGIWDFSREGVLQCCIVTTAANGAMCPIHNRMPVILPRDAVADWLDPAATTSIDELMVPAPDGWLRIRPVSAFVNNARNDGPACTE